MNEDCSWGNDPITKSQLRTIERVFDSLFSKLNIDIKFTNHFFDRLNDARNKEQITVCELSSIFTELYKKYGLHLQKIGNSHKETQEIIKSHNSKINIPIAIKWDSRKNEIVLVTKTIMRKKDFKGRNAVLRVESFRTFLNEGGQFGHLQNVYDVNFTFSQLKSFISDALAGKLDYVEEKTDAVNLMFTVRNGVVVGARNKGDSKNFGDNALTAQTIRDKFKGRPLEHAYGTAIDELQNAIDSLTDKQKDKIFGNGKFWMSVEVMGNGAENIIEYGTDELRLHGTIEFDVDGNKISGINKDSAKILDGMLRQRNKTGDKFKIMKLNRVDLPKVSDFKNLKTKYIGKLTKIMKENKLNDSNTVLDMMLAQWDTMLSKKTKNKELIEVLKTRFVMGDKSTNLTQIKKQFPDDVKLIQEMNKQAGAINKQFKLPMEKIFLELGVDIISNISKLMAVNPDKTIQKMKNTLDKSVSAIKKSGNAKMLAKLSMELDRLNTAGKILPTEGITFFWNGNFMKLTGAFAPLNQIIGMTYRL
jgi:hypothetical protein